MDSEQTGKITLSNDETVDVDVATANVLMTVFNALEDDNKKRMLDLLDSNAENFLKVVNFGWNSVEV